MSRKKKENMKENKLLKLIRTMLKTIEAAILAIPGLMLTVLANPGPPITAVKWALYGVAWIWIGDYLIKHSATLRFILETLAVFATLASVDFSITMVAVEAAIDVVFSIANAAGGVINTFGSWFGDDHIVPKLPMIPIKMFPIVNFDSYISSLDDFGNATATCSAFNNIGFELVYPLRSLLNERFCPIVRYTWSTIIYTPFSWCMGFGHFDADPNGNNCNEPSAWTLCFWLKFGYLLTYVLAPLHLLYWLFPAIKKLVLDGLSVAGTAIGFTFSALSGILHETFKSIERKKRY